MIKISRAALLAATLGLSAVPAVGLVPAVAEETAAASSSSFTSNLTIPTIEAVGSSMDEAALRDVLGGNLAPHAEELASLNATSITIPSITLEMTVSEGGKPVSSTVVYKDVMLADVKDGVAATATVGSSTSTSDEGTFSFGKLAASDVDLRGLLAMYSLVPAADDSGAMRVMYKDFSFAGGHFDSPTVNCTLGQISVASFSARPLKVTFAQLMEAGQKLEAASGAPPADAVATVVTFLTDVFQAFKSDPVSMDGLNCAGTDENDNPFKLSLGGLTMAGYAPGIYPALTIDDLEITANDKDVVKLDTATIKSIDLSGPIAVLEAEADKLTPMWFDTNGRRLVPAFGGLSFGGLKVDIADPEKQGSRVQASVDSFDLSLANYVNGIPTTVSAKSSGVDVPLPDDGDPQVAMLKALGIDTVNLGYDIDIAWDKAAQMIAANPISISGEGLGSFALGASIGNATEGLFDTNPSMMQGAALGVTVKSVTLDITDAGAADIFLPVIAQEQHQDAATFRAQMAAGLEGAVIQLLGTSDATRQLSRAVGDFISGKAKTLSITISAKSDAGVPAVALMQMSQTAKDPMQLMPQLTSLLDITGSAK